MRKLITCEICGKQEWRAPSTRFCLSCRRQRNAERNKRSNAKRKAKKLKAEKLKAQEETKK